MRKMAVALGLAVALVVGALGWQFLGDLGGDDGGGEDETTIRVSYATVVRTDLIQTDTLAGSLRFAQPRSVRTQLAGTVTSLAEEASTLERGTIAFEIDGVPVFVLRGERPAWRPFVNGMEDGPDVAQLEENLAALGRFDEDPDEVFDDSTEEAVAGWREEVGLVDASVIELGRVIFLPGPARVGTRYVEVGQSVVSGVAVLEVADERQEVLIELDPDELDLVVEGDVVIVELPDGEEVDGVISEVGRVVRPKGPDPAAPEVIDVIVSLGEPVLDIDRAPVDVRVETDRAAGVLAVPVRALLSLSDGGYALEVVRGDGTELIGVEIGDFAGGMVEVKGGIEEGDRVVVPA